MLKCRGKVSSEQWAVGSTERAASARLRPRRRVFLLLLTAHCLLLTASCRRDMQDQPKAKPYRSSSFFKDGLSSRAPVEGTVARGWLRADTELFTGKKSKPLAAASPASGPVATTPTANASAAQVAAAYPDDVDKFPFPITQEILDRGQQRFQIFCSVCHGMTGNADGMIVRRGFRKPPSYHEPRLREAPVGHFFDVVTNGWGAMPSYASQVPVQDRWAIAAYIRALQFSQAAAQPAAQTPAPAVPAAKPTAPPKASGGRK
jgi:mono/diheme cytochrome c family protein